MKQHVLRQNVVLYYDQVDYFKENTISVKFIFSYKEKVHDALAILTNLFKDRTEKYPTKQRFEKAQDDLYGAIVNASAVSMGESLILDVKVRCIDDHYVNEALFAAQIALLSEVINHPLITDETFQEAVKVTLDSLNRDEEKPMNRALRSTFASGYADQAIAFSSKGSKQGIPKVTIKQVRALHQWLLNESRIEIYAVGHCDGATAEALVLEHFDFRDREIKYQVLSRANHQGPRLAGESTDLSQSTLILCAQIDLEPTRRMYTALRLANCYFGEVPSSLLFNEVREKQSLCYSIYSTLLPYDGLLLVMTQVARENLEKSSELIQALLTQAQETLLDDETLEGYKKILRSRYETIDDDPGSIIDFQLRNNVLGKVDDRAAQLKEIDEITGKDVKAVLQGLYFNYIFMLKGDKDDAKVSE